MADGENTGISVVIPFYNEEENVVSVLKEVQDCVPGAEIIAIDDGSSDATGDLIAGVQGVTAIRFGANRGQSAAMLTGLKQASHDICVVMDGDGQNDPADIPAMIACLNQADAVFGVRKVRKDSWDRRIASKVANSIRRLFIKDGVTDTGCSLKAFRREMVEFLPPFNGVHRFMGAFFLDAGYRIHETPVNHRARVGGISKYNNFNRAVRGIYDLVGVGWYVNRRVNTRLD